MPRQYKQQWKVPSDNGGDTYTVSLTFEGEYQCSCKGWIFKYRKLKQPCKHITDVKNGLYDKDPHPAYNFEFAQVKEVKLADDRVTIMVPLRPADDTHFLLTIVYDLLQLGVFWGDIQTIEHLPRDWSKNDVQHYISMKGRKIHGEFVEGYGFSGYQVVPV